MKVICNTSPLILLAKISRLDLLTQLYETVIIPSLVLTEVEATPDKEADQVGILLRFYFKVIKLNYRKLPKVLLKELLRI